MFAAPNKAMTTASSTNTRSELRQMLRGEGDGEPSIIIEGDGPRRFQLRIGPDGVEQGAPPAAIEIDRGGEA